MTRFTWGFRPILWFAVASMITTVFHELTHALVAYSAGVPATLFNYSVDLDAAQAAIDTRALIGVSGPLVCLGLGILAFLSYQRMRETTVALPLLYLTVFGVGTFFGNLMSTPFVGDFSAASVALQLSMPVRYAGGVLGALALATVHFLAGRELTRWVPTTCSRASSILGMVVSPALAGTAAVVLVNLPMPPAAVAARTAEASFWFFAAAGALARGRKVYTGLGRLGLTWADIAVAVLATIVVRVLVGGVVFIPANAG